MTRFVMYSGMADTTIREMANLAAVAIPSRHSVADPATCSGALGARSPISFCFPERHAALETVKQTHCPANSSSCELALRLLASLQRFQGPLGQETQGYALLRIHLLYRNGSSCA